MRHLAALFLLAGLAALSAAETAVAQGAPRSIGDCERIKGDLAYNQCLAMFGPRANTRSGGDGAASAGGASASAASERAAPVPRSAAAEEAAPAPRYGRASRSKRKVGRGRQRATFTVGSGRRSARRGHRRR